MTTSPVMHLLDNGVPLTLLLDLMVPDGPDSVAINAAERPPGDHVLLEADLRAPVADRARHVG